MQERHATQPRMALLPTWTVSTWMPSCWKIFSISPRAMDVLPPTRGLPLISKTFIVVHLVTDRMAAKGCIFIILLQ
jgi:hypothetical protein